MLRLKKMQILSHSFQAYLEYGCVAPATQNKEGWVCFSMHEFISSVYSTVCDLKTNRFSDKHKPIKKNKYSRKCVHSTWASFAQYRPVLSPTHLHQKQDKFPDERKHRSSGEVVGVSWGGGGDWACMINGSKGLRQIASQNKRWWVFHPFSFPHFSRQVPCGQWTEQGHRQPITYEQVGQKLIN